MTRRWVLALLVALAACGCTASPPAAEQPRDQGSLGPAITALRGVPLPQGFQACTLVRNADLCWVSTGTEVAAVPVLLSALQRLGATDLAPRCVRKRASVLCRIDGRLAGSVLDTLVSRNGTATQVLAYAAREAPIDVLRGGTPVPIP